MRTIKFRGKSLKTGNWITGSLIAKEDGKVQIFTEYDKPYNMIFKDVDPETVGQYTGMDDLHDRPIYEGDIVKLEILENPLAYEGIYPEHSEVDWQGIVKYTDGMYYCVDEKGFPLEISSSYTTDNLSELVRHHVVAVIGNIYDNPDIVIGNTYANN